MANRLSGVLVALLALACPACSSEQPASRALLVGIDGASLRVAGPLLDQGMHCLIEKPLAPNSAEGRELLERGRKGGAMVSVGHVERFNPVVLAARKHHIVPMFIESHRIHPFSFRSVDVAGG